MKLIEYFFFTPRPPMGYVSSVFISTIPYIFLALVIYAIFRSFVICTRKKEVSVKRELLYVLVVIYFTLVVKFTIVPDWSFHRDLETQEIKFFSGVGYHLPVNLIPLKNVFSFLQGDVHVNAEDTLMTVVLNLAGSLLLLAPMGILLPILMPQLNNWKRILLIGIGLSCAIEVIQFFIGRVADVDDILLNVMGMLGGYVFYGILLRKGELCHD